MPEYEERAFSRPPLNPYVLYPAYSTNMQSSMRAGQKAAAAPLPSKLQQQMEYQISEDRTAKRTVHGPVFKN